MTFTVGLIIGAVAGIVFTIFAEVGLAYMITKSNLRPLTPTDDKQ